MLCSLFGKPVEANPGVPQDRVTVYTWAVNVYLKLGGTAGAKVLLVLSFVTFPRGEGIRHEPVQVDYAAQGVRLIVLLCIAEEMAAATAADDKAHPISRNFKDIVEFEDRAPSLSRFCLEFTFHSFRRCSLILPI